MDIEASNMVQAGASQGAIPRTGLSALKDTVRQRLRRVSSSRSPRSTGDDDRRGPYGLNLLSEPRDTRVDLVFVHGLKGGSCKTWTHPQDKTQSSYWPKEWLPFEAGFKHARIHSYGYNADWTDRKANVLDVYDFAKALLGDLLDCPGIRQTKTTPLILVGHSMGGLVIKKAYLLATSDSTYAKLATRMQAMVFLGTPHRGSDVAPLLSNILSFTFGAKNYVKDLERRSPLLRGINDDFRNIYQDLQILSFYETVKTRMVHKGVLLVPQESGVMGLPGERTQPLNADHRYICKFKTPEDPNYVTLRNALLALIDDLEEKRSIPQDRELHGQLKAIACYINAPKRPENHLAYTNELQVEGSCLWLLSRPSFQTWQFEHQAEDSVETGTSKIFWLTGKPGTGKSVMAGQVIRDLESGNADCSYYFFKHNDRAVSSIPAMLRSLAYQMAETDPIARRELLSLTNDAEFFDKDNERSVWRSLFLTRILSIDHPRPHYWVIDALDECPDYASLFPLLSQLGERSPIRILITSRPLPLLERLFAKNKIGVLTEPITREDTLEDIRLFVRAREAFLPAESEQVRENLIEKLVQKSNGSFLWASLVTRELELVYSEQQVTEVLSQVPEGMDEVYTRILNAIESDRRNQTLAKAILAWTICAARPLTLGELKEALRLDTGHDIHHLETAIAGITGCLVDVSIDGRVLLVHETVKAFLTKTDLVSNLAVHMPEGHCRLATVCMTYLCGNELQWTKRITIRPEHEDVRRSVLAQYACLHFSHHLAESCPSADAPLAQIDQLLRTNILTWIELVIKADGLEVLLTTSKHLKAYLARRARSQSRVVGEAQRVAAWADDLVRIVAAFGRNIKSHPESIHFLVPSLSPPKSIINQEFSSFNTLEVVGCSDEGWDDQTSCLAYADPTRCIASSETRVAVGLSTGIIHLYKTTTMEEVYVLNHGEGLSCLCFAVTRNLVASYGLKRLVLWDTQTGAQLWNAALDYICTVCFTQDDSAIMLGYPNGKVSKLDTLTGTLKPSVEFLEKRVNEDKVPEDGRVRVCSEVHMCSEMNLLAAVRGDRERGKHYAPILNSFISFWDLEDVSWVSHVYPDNSAVPSHRTVCCLVINPNPSLELAAAAYSDGELVVFNPFDGRRKATFMARFDTDACRLAASPDGRTLALASAEHQGTIQLFDFKTLRLLYRVTIATHGIEHIVFSSDNLRFFTLGSNFDGSKLFEIWEPTVLVRNREVDDTTSKPCSDEDPHTALLVDYKSSSQDLIITAVCEHSSGHWIFVGRQNGSVAVVDVRTGKQTQELVNDQGMLKPRAIRLLAWTASTQKLAIAYAGDAGEGPLRKGIKDSVTIRTIQSLKENKWQASEPSLTIRAQTTIRQLLFDRSGAYLLVSTAHSDEVWHVATATSVGVRHRIEIWWSCCWINHPMSHSQLLLIESGVAHNYNWRDLSRVSRPEGIALLGRGGIQRGLDYVVASRSGQHLCVRQHKAQLGAKHEYPELGIYLTSTLNAKVKKSNAIAEYRELNGRIKNIIGVHGSRFLFLDVDGWICSLDIDSAVVETQYSRHFFIPSSWYNVRELLFAVTVNGSVALARKDEIIIFHHGLDSLNKKIAIDPAKNMGMVTADTTKGHSMPLASQTGGTEEAKLSKWRRPGADLGAVRLDGEILLPLSLEEVDNIKRSIAASRVKYLPRLKYWRSPEFSFPLSWQPHLPRYLQIPRNNEGDEEDQNGDRGGAVAAPHITPSQSHQERVSQPRPSSLVRQQFPGRGLTHGLRRTHEYREELARHLELELSTARLSSSPKESISSFTFRAKKSRATRMELTTRTPIRKRARRPVAIEEDMDDEEEDQEEDEEGEPALPATAQD